MWMGIMIAHHQGAIEMSNDGDRFGFEPYAKALAPTIVTAQQAEIDRDERSARRLRLDFVKGGRAGPGGGAGR